MSGIILFDTGDATPVELDWSDALGDSITLSDVTHTVPTPLVKLGETFTDTASFVGVGGAVHGGLYQIEAQATLSATNPDGSPQILNRQFTLRGWNS